MTRWKTIWKESLGFIQRRSFTGTRVLIQCRFKVNNSTSVATEIFLEAERTTDQHGVYKLDVAPLDGFECREGHELRSACRPTLVQSSSSACNVRSSNVSCLPNELRLGRKPASRLRKFSAFLPRSF